MEEKLGFGKLGGEDQPEKGVSNPEPELEIVSQTPDVVPVPLGIPVETFLRQQEKETERRKQEDKKHRYDA
ncbi:hypothetical protein HY968_02860 [Candidatus Kaiserbacteria bacterium]|nr:hypothetical protein [Candidatus Kaiserbacteria bacterium]